MSNVYHVGKCPHCGETFVTPYDGGEDETDTITVHGGANLREAINSINNGYPFSIVAGKFCGFCGNATPCGCSNPSPQKSNFD